jgi:hypothetical protein
MHKKTEYLHKRIKICFKQKIRLYILFTLEISLMAEQLKVQSKEQKKREGRDKSLLHYSSY